MTRSFSKTTSYGPARVTALCVAIAVAFVVHGAPTLADNAQLAAATDHAAHMIMAC